MGFQAQYLLEVTFCWIYLNLIQFWHHCQNDLLWGKLDWLHFENMNCDMLWWKCLADKFYQQLCLVIHRSYLTQNIIHKWRTCMRQECYIYSVADPRGSGEGYGRAPHLNSNSLIFVQFSMMKILSMGVLDSAMFLRRHNQVHISHYVIIICSGSWLCDFSPR